MLTLKNNKTVTVDEKMTLGINFTASGLPDDCTFLGNIDVSREFKLDDLKETILAMSFFSGREIALECVRLREKLASMYFGKIFRDQAIKGKQNNQR